MALTADDAFVYSKHLLSTLQEKIWGLRKKTAANQAQAAVHGRLLGAYTDCLLSLHQAVRGFLLALAASLSKESQRDGFPAPAIQLLEALQGLDDLAGTGSDHIRIQELVEAARLERQEQLDQELDAIIAAATEQQLPERTRAKLLSVVKSLRQLEQCCKFHARLAAECEAISAGGAYTLDNFAYGSTPLTSWRAVMASPPTQQAVRAAMQPSGRQYVVWGSSTGWLVFFGALTYGWRSVGVEILRGLHDEAQRIAAEHGIAGVELLCQDFLSHDVSPAGLVLLANQCWDAQLMEQARAKLALELPAGAVVVDYTGALQGCAAFEVVQQVPAATSWAPEQSFWVYRRRLRSHGGDGAPAGAC